MYALNYMHFIKCFANWVYRSVPAGIRTGFAGLASRFSLYPLSQAGRHAVHKLFSKFVDAQFVINNEKVVRSCLFTDTYTPSVYSMKNVAKLIRK